MIYGKCKMCGCETSSPYRSTLSQFCSHSCANNYNAIHVRKYKLSERLTVKCDCCNKDITILASSHRNKFKHIFCSKECEFAYKKAHYKISICPVCGKTFKKNRSQTCSLECASVIRAMKTVSKKLGINFNSPDEYIAYRDKKIADRQQQIDLRKNKEFVCKGRNKEYIKEYRQKNHDRLLKKHQDRLKTDELYRFKTDIRKKIGHCFTRRSVKKNAHTEEILGCSFEFFKSYIASLFKEGMSFDNYGEWQLDHIIPLSTANTVEDVIKLCHYTNYQPLWAKENRLKSNKIL